MDTPSKAWALNQLNRRRHQCLRRALNLRHQRGQQRPHALRDMMHQQNQQTRKLIARPRGKTL
jgi:hypothetical protein